jgi:nitrogen fixation-related uncharacterized protein
MSPVISPIAIIFVLLILFLWAITTDRQSQ